MLSTQSKTEFSTARNKAFIEEWLSAFNGKTADLLSFDAVKDILHLHDSSYKGLQEIELDKIVGSTGRYRDFTRTFLPKNHTTEERWRRISSLAENEGFPPIDVIQVGEVYFVRDGNHRVSVSRMNGLRVIEAYVIEYKTPVPLTKEDDIDAILLKMGEAEFLAATKLDELCPGHGIRLTEPGRYRLVQQHIQFHKYLKEREFEREITDEEAVVSWYDTVYVPIVQLILAKNLLDHFPERTEADLYAWLLLHRAALEDEIQTLGNIPTEDVIAEVTMENAPNPFVRLMGYISHQNNLQQLPLKVTHKNFIEKTELDTTRPNHQIKFIHADSYRLIADHINVHKYLKEIECNCELTYADAAASWYDTVYLPIIEKIRDNNILKYFPNNSEGDLYIGLVTRRAAIEEQQHKLGVVSDEQLIEDLENYGQSGSWTRWIPFFHRTFDVEKLLPN